MTETQKENLSYVQARVEALVEHARELGVVITVTQRISPINPQWGSTDIVEARLARGHYEP